MHYLHLEVRPSGYYNVVCSKCGEIGTAMTFDAARRTLQYHDERTNHVAS